jgi:hypothetical protein
MQIQTGTTMNPVVAHRNGGKAEKRQSKKQKSCASAPSWGVFAIPRPLAFSFSRLLVLSLSSVAAVTSIAASATPASLPADARSTCSGAAALVPQAACARSGAGRLPIAKATTIIVDPSATATVRYAAGRLQAELARLFGIDAVILRQRDGLRVDGASIFVDDIAVRRVPERFARLRELPAPGEDGYRLGVFPQERTAVVLGHGGDGVIRGAFALAQLAMRNEGGCALPEVLISDTPEMHMRFTRGILSDQQSPLGTAPEERLTCELDWWARWGLNYALMPLRPTQGMQEQDGFARWCIEAAHERGMKVGVSLGGRSLCPSNAAQMDAYLSKARRLLALGCDFFLVLFDDLPRERLGGHCERCVRKFGGSLAAEQRFILEALADVLSEFGPDRRLIWCPTYYSLGMTGYIGGAEGPDAYFSALGASKRVGNAYMFHCAFDRDFNAYLDAKGLKHRIWWYNGIRTEYYMVSREFDGYEGWGPRLRIPGLKDFHSFFPPFENGWLMPGYTSADPSLHRCIAPLVPAARDAQSRTIIPRASWQELAHLPERMEGIYLCGASAAYHIALAGVFAAHPKLFDQQRSEEAVLDALFSRGASRYAVPWQRAYAQAQLLLARAQGGPLPTAAAARIKRLLAQMETLHRSLKEQVANGKPALPRSLVDGLLDAMDAWRSRISALAKAPPISQH